MCSQHMFVRPVLSLDARSWWPPTWLVCFFGRAIRRLVPDNLATGVDRPDLYDPKINPVSVELAAHYGC